MSARLSRMIAAGLSAAACAGAVIVAAPAASAATPCQADCISGLTATPSPDGIKLSVTTSTPALVRAEVYFGQSKIMTFAPPNGAPLAKTHEYASLTGLSQGVWYRYVVKAADSYGNVRTEEGVLRTPRRTAIVTYKNIHVIDDSDAVGAGEFIHMGSLAGSSAKGAMLGGSWSTDSDHPVPAAVASHTIAGAVYGVPAKFALREDDQDGFGVGYICLAGDPCLPNWSTGSDDDFDWATAAGSLKFTSALGDSTGNFSVTTPGSAALKFRVDGTWSQRIRNVALPVRELRATSFNRSVTLNWTAPAANGGAPITSYKITSDKGFSTFVPASARSVVVNGLTNAVAASYDVVALNSEGESWPTSIVAASRNVPGAVTNLSVVAADGVVSASWKPTVIPGTAITGYNVFVNGSLAKVTPSTTTVIPAANAVPVTISVEPYNATGPGPRTSAAPVTPYIATKLAGFNTTELVAPAGTSASDGVVVTTGGQAGRPVRLQYRNINAASWSTAQVVTADANGLAILTVGVKQGLTEFRAYAPAWKSYGPAVSAVRSVKAASTLIGWKTGSMVVPTGAILSNVVKVSPGAFRTLVLQSRPVGATPWTTVNSAAADVNGLLEVAIKVKKGAQEYRVIAAANAAYGTATATPIRVITGS